MFMLEAVGQSDLRSIQAIVIQIVKGTGLRVNAAWLSRSPSDAEL